MRFEFSGVAVSSLSSAQRFNPEGNSERGANRTNRLLMDSMDFWLKSNQTWSSVSSWTLVPMGKLSLIQLFIFSKGQGGSGTCPGNTGNVMRRHPELDVSRFFPIYHDQIFNVSLNVPNIPRMGSGTTVTHVEVRALCRTHEFFHLLLTFTHHVFVELALCTGASSWWNSDVSLHANAWGEQC